MKTIFTLLASLFITTAAMAQNQNNDVKVETIEMGIVLEPSTAVTTPCAEAQTNVGNEVARLYKFKNSRIKKELNFTTKQSRAKLV